MYEKVETEASRGYLKRLAEAMGDEFCLIGGWAIYYTVNERYRKSTGKDYLGSRDIDIGVKDLGSFKRTDRFLLKEMHFDHLSFRYVKYLDHDTGAAIEPEMAKKVPIHMLLELYVDMMVPKYSEQVKEELGFIPPDEPILETVFSRSQNRIEFEMEHIRVAIPAPEFLLAMKLNSIGNRTKDHKRVKDLCDITAICLFSPKDRDELIKQAVANADPLKTRTIQTCLEDEDFDQCAAILGIPNNTIRSLLERFHTP